MKTTIVTTRPRWQRALGAVMAMGLGALLLAVLLIGLRGAPAQADAGILYVDGATGSDTTDCTNPAAPCATIGYALSQAESGDEIRVAEGTYTETLGIGITVTLRGGYEAAGWTRDITAHPTIVDGGGADAVVIWIGSGATVTVEGFTVQGANHVSDDGGGIYVRDTTTVISATVVQSNATGGSGGGVCIEGDTSDVSVINSSLLNNTAGGAGGGLKGWGWPTITLDNVEVRGNTAQGGGGGLSVGSITITNSQVMSNTAGDSGGGISANIAHIYNSEISGNEANGTGTIFGGGISMSADGAGGYLVIRDSAVSDNRAVGTHGSIGGGIDAEMAEATIVNTIISGNSAQSNAGVSLWQTVLTMTNSLVVSNFGEGISSSPTSATIMNVTVADNAGAGIAIHGPPPEDPQFEVNARITNSIMWRNVGGDYGCHIPGAGGCTLAYSDVGRGDTTGTGNISADPLFVDAANDDYHLQADSPCIDAGTPVGAPTHDIEGTPRDTTPDMGAYEWGRFRIFLPLTLKSFASKQ